NGPRVDLLLRRGRRFDELVWNFLTGGIGATSGTGQSRSGKAPWRSETVFLIWGGRQRQKLMTELEGATKSAQCVDSSRIVTSKVEAAQHRKSRCRLLFHAISQHS